jgi:SAM-dependent methyltransferase
VTGERDVPGKSQQTLTSFSDKWQNNPKLAFAETLDESSEIFRWILTRNGFRSPADLETWLSPRTRILDAGCGNGRITAMLRKYAPASAEILGIDLAPAVAKENLSGLDRTRVEAGDLMGDLTGFGTFDLIYCQEVLHHTADPRTAFLNLCGRLTDGGEIAIYVYKRKAPLREYADDYVRSRISALPYEQAMEAMHGLTELGRVLSEIEVNVRVPDVPVIGIEAGEYDVQRLLYHFFLKCFWNRSLTFADNAAVNYDWYHPQLCTRHTLSEVEEWIAAAGLTGIHACVDHYGITVRAVRPRSPVDGA